MAELVPQATELQLWILWSPDVSPQCGAFAVWLASLQQAVLDVRQEQSMKLPSECFRLARF